MDTPHPYQTEYDNAIEAGWKTFRKQIAVSPTGSGKTNMFCWLIERFHKRGKRCLMLVDQKHLVWQPKKRLYNLTGIHADVEQAEWHAPKDSKVVFATVQSMAGRLEDWPADSFDLVIVDEADKSIAPEFLSVLKHFEPHALTVGFTATPMRSDQQNLGVFYENTIELENLWSLIRKGYLSPITVKSIPVKLDLTGLSNKGADYNDDELDELITPHLEALACQLQINAWDRTSLIFLPLVKTCEKFNEIARDIGLNSEFIYGEDPDRDNKMERFEHGKIDVMSNAILMTRGVDVPRINCLGIWRPTKSVSLYFQMTGRGTRGGWLYPVEGKTDCLLLDPLYQSMKRLICRPANLIATTQEIADSITEIIERDGGMPGDVASQLDLLKIAGEASSMREASLKKKLEEHRNKQAKTISAEEFAMKHHSMETAEFEATMAWEQKPVTPKQAKYLNEAGIDMATVNGTAHASRLLDIYFKNKPLKLATMAVRQKMRQLGCSNWNTATESEGRQFFASLRNRKEQPAFL